MAKIFCFSGTGNSLYAARKIAAETGAEVCNMRDLAQCDDNFIGFVFPTHYFGLPKNVYSFLENIIISNKNAYIFSVTVYGGFSPGVNGAVDKLLKKQGLRLSYGAKVIMSSNYLPIFKANDSNKLWKRADKRLDEIARDVKNLVLKRLGAYTIFNKIAQRIYPPNMGNCAENFTVNDCNSCGLCERVCPNDNITLENGAPKFGEKCGHCLGCLNVCPADAIDYGKSTRGKRRYKNRRISAEEIIKFNSAK